jgi:hypothetical protein
MCIELMDSSWITEVRVQTSDFRHQTSEGFPVAIISQNADKHSLLSCPAVVTGKSRTGGEF